MDRVYIAIDLKSFYASVECVEHGFNPLKTNLVVADESRTEKTICLAVSPSLKAYGIPGRARLFEVIQKVNEINKQRVKACGRFTGDSFYDDEVQSNPNLALNFYIAEPRMNTYMKYSSKIYSIYLKYVSKEDIHVYSIDEVFIDVSDYLNTYKMSPRTLAMCMVKDVFNETGITATCGIGTNLYLCKVAMDIVAKHIKEDENGVRIAELNEYSYRQKLWDHQPLTDFWRVGKGIANKLINNGIYTMGDIARKSLEDEDKLYKLFGINAELLIDHAWGYEPVTIKDIKAYKPTSNSLSSGQVLKEPYSFEKARLIVKEMADSLVLDMVEKGLLCKQIVLNVGYDVVSLKDYDGEIKQDPYGRNMPKMAHGSYNLEDYCSSSKLIMNGFLYLFDNIVNPKLYVRRIYVVACNIIKEEDKPIEKSPEQLDLFTDYKQKDIDDGKLDKALAKEKKMQKAIIEIQRKYGKNSILKANNLEEGATMLERNKQVGGHKA